MMTKPDSHLNYSPAGTLVIGILLLSALTLFLPGCDEHASGTITAKIGTEWFTLEVAETREKRTRGLMGRTEIPENSGMIFIFNNTAERSFWMKNCLIDLDILYLDRGQRIISAYNMKAQPPQAEHENENTYENRIRDSASYPSRGQTQFVIELKAGKIQELRLTRGEKIQLDQDQLKTLIRAADDNP